MSEVPYTPLSEPNDLVAGECTDCLYRVCKNRLMKKQPVDHTPTEYLTQRCEFLENEVMKLRDHDMKCRIQIKELEAKFFVLEEAIQDLTAPKQTQAVPFGKSRTRRTVRIVGRLISTSLLTEGFRRNKSIQIDSARGK